ncbi:LysM peptidoglycan-binding domain-containing protein [Pseudarthrobacter sp. J1738]|uniref:LysM peptidoglycan-binding domain-containing protein n=1 Tax=unclassified Pseudarthrobacter TaxID=2647000 RepID=UPI003D2A22FE
MSAVIAAPVSLGGTSSQRKVAAPAGGTKLTLTRRGRAIFIGAPLMLLAVVVLMFAGMLLQPAKASEGAGSLQPTSAVQVTVQPGQSLWSIAAKVSPERDPRDVVTEILQINNLRSAELSAGQQIFVPSAR